MRISLDILYIRMNNSFSNMAAAILGHNYTRKDQSAVNRQAVRVSLVIHNHKLSSHREKSNVINGLTKWLFLDGDCMNAALMRL